MSDEIILENQEQEPEYESLMNDALFHMVFANNEKALRGLISCLLNIPDEEMARIDVLNPMQYTDAKAAKLTVLDLRLHMSDGRFINIEMQVRRYEYWTNRSLVYSCRQITDQSNVEGFKYSDLEPVIQIAIMNHTLFEDHKRFFARYLPRDDEGYPYTDKLQFYVMDLKAIGEATEEQRKQGLVEWADAFTAHNWEQVQKLSNPAIKEAVNQMRTIMNSPEQRQIVWDRKLAQMDYDTQIESARNKGRDEGRAEGKMATLIDLVRKNILSVKDAADQANMSIPEFCKKTGLSVQQ